jgi:uncharacterized protein with PIN domain
MRHEELGEPRRVSRDRRCSLCDADLPEGSALTLHANAPKPGARDIESWIYCEACAATIMARLDFSRVIN